MAQFELLDFKSILCLSRINLSLLKSIIQLFPFKKSTPKIMSFERLLAIINSPLTRLEPMLNSRVVCPFVSNDEPLAVTQFLGFFIGLRLKFSFEA